MAESAQHIVDSLGGVHPRISATGESQLVRVVKAMSRVASGVMICIKNRTRCQERVVGTFPTVYRRMCRARVSSVLTYCVKRFWKICMPGLRGQIISLGVSEATQRIRS